MRTPVPALLLLLLAPPLAADGLLKVKTRLEGLNLAGQPPESEVEVWVGSDRVRRDDGDASTILRLDQGKLYVVNHADKTYSALSLADLAKAPEGDPLKTVVEVKPTGESKKIRNWTARRFKVRITNAAGLVLESDTWASVEIAAWATLASFTTAQAALQPGGAVWGRELLRIEGYPVLNETSVKLGNSRFRTKEELLAAEEKEPPAGTYDPPKGYSENPPSVPP
jgi:hypothetical protein